MGRPVWSALSFKSKKMSWSIPAQIEQDFISGRAQYRTFQTGYGGQSILPVPPNSYAVIFGYDFSPAGGGLVQNIAYSNNVGQVSPNFIKVFETQQVSFYTGQDFFPFVHHVNTNQSSFSGFITYDIDTTPICRQVYITSSNDITITVGLILTTPQISANAIPITNRTPSLLSYGGSAQSLSTQTNLGPAVTPISFMQPSIKDYQDFAFGILPNTASGQVFATPDATNGLIDPSAYLAGFSVAARDSAASNYFLNLHYALYSSNVPEQRG